MGTVIMMFILPIGVIVYFFDKKLSKQNEEIFNNYIDKVKCSDLTPKEMLDEIDDMYYANGYKRVSKTDTQLVVEKKHFNLGVLFIFFGLLTYFGVFFYLIYYYFILKPKIVEVNI